MAQEDPPRAGRRAIALGARRAAGADALGDLFAAAGQALAALFRAEADVARLAPWLPVAFGIGILIYFAAPAEPSPIAAAIALVLMLLAVLASREYAVVFALTLALAFVAAGFAASTLRAAMVAHPVLARSPGPITLKGFVESRDATRRPSRGPGAAAHRSGRLRPRSRADLCRRSPGKRVQYFRYSPTSLPWMRTRSGPKMRVS
jgi:competence protein ComEC